MASIYTTVVIAFGRYLAVSKPISTMVNSGIGDWRNVIAYILPVIGFSIVFKLPIFFEFLDKLYTYFLLMVIKIKMCAYMLFDVFSITHSMW